MQEAFAPCTNVLIILYTSSDFFFLSQLNRSTAYETTNATVRFPLDEKLPLALIKKLVQARVRKNDEAEKKK